METANLWRWCYTGRFLTTIFNATMLHENRGMANETIFCATCCTTGVLHSTIFLDWSYATSISQAAALFRFTRPKQISIIAITLPRQKFIKMLLILGFRWGGTERTSKRNLDKSLDKEKAWIAPFGRFWPCTWQDYTLHGVIDLFQVVCVYFLVLSSL